MSLTLAIVTATTNFERALPCLKTWCVPPDVPLIVVLNGTNNHTISDIHEKTATFVSAGGYLGTVAAFKKGVDYALKHTKADIIACFHDDLEIQQSDWITPVLRHFKERGACGLAGFGGAIGLGDDQIYRKPYEPVQLARKGFRSNMIGAEVHGLRSALREQVACLDGFSQIGRREFWQGWGVEPSMPSGEPPWHLLDRLGVVHHAYDGMLGCIARRYGWEVWYLPIRCNHLGGQTAVGDPQYQEWAKSQHVGGDHGFWVEAHRIWYDEFKDVLPIRI